MGLSIITLDGELMLQVKVNGGEWALPPLYRLASFRCSKE